MWLLPEVRYGDTTISATIADGPQRMFTTGQWDATGQFVEGLDQVKATATSLPYICLIVAGPFTIAYPSSGGDGCLKICCAKGRPKISSFTAGASKCHPMSEYNCL